MDNTAVTIEMLVAMQDFVVVTLDLYEGRLVRTENHLYFITERVSGWEIVHSIAKTDVSGVQVDRNFMGTTHSIVTKKGLWRCKDVDESIDLQAWLQGQSSMAASKIASLTEGSSNKTESIGASEEWSSTSLRTHSEDPNATWEDLSPMVASPTQQAPFSGLETWNDGESDQWIANENSEERPDDKQVSEEDRNEEDDEGGEGQSILEATSTKDEYAVFDELPRETQLIYRKALMKKGVAISPDEALSEVFARYPDLARPMLQILNTGNSVADTDGDSGGGGFASGIRWVVWFFLALWFYEDCASML